MKVVNKWNRRLLRAVSRRAGLGMSGNNALAITGENDDHSVASNEDDVRIQDSNGEVIRTVPRRTREKIMESMPPLGTLLQNSPQHLDLLYALAYPSKAVSSDIKELHTPKNRSPSHADQASMCPLPGDDENDGHDEGGEWGELENEQPHEALQESSLFHRPQGDILGVVDDLGVIQENDEDQTRL